jgi:hypothetical protein
MDGRSGSSAGGLAGLMGSLAEGDTQDAFCFERVGRAGNVVECAGIERFEASFPVRYMRENDDGSPARLGGKDLYSRCEVTVGKSITAEYALE